MSCRQTNKFPLWKRGRGDFFEVAIREKSPYPLFQRGKKQFLGRLCGVLVLLVLLSVACDKKSNQDDPKPPPGEVWVTPEQVKNGSIQIAEVRVQPFGGIIQTAGRIAFDDRRVAHIFSPVTGRVIKILADLGERVKAGQPLALINSPDLGSALSDLRKADAALAAARRDYSRQKELYEAQAAALRDYEAAKSIFEQALAEHDRAKQKVDLFQVKSAATSQEFLLRSPIAGEVVARAANPGMEVQGQYSLGSAQELFTVGEIDSLWLLADVYEVDLPRIKLGMAVQAQVVSYPNTTYTGTIDWVSGTIDPVTRTAKIRCQIANPKRLLKPEMFAQVSIQVAKENALTIPRDAVVLIGNQTFVFIDKGMTKGKPARRRFEQRPVILDPHGDDNLIVVSHGLAQGENIVSRGVILLTGAA